MKTIKTVLLAISLALFTLQATGQSFTRSQVYDSLTLTGQFNKATLFDYDGDGDDDVFNYGATNDSRILVFENNNGNFDSSFVFYDNGGSSSIPDLTLIDFDNDGDTDIIAAGTSLGIILKFENVGNGNFNLTTQSNIISGINENIASADIDNDGIPDLVYSNFNPNEMRWNKNLGGGNFSTTQNTIAAFPGTSSAGKVVSFKMADLDNDGDVDIITRYAVDESAMSINDGNGSFATTFNFPVNVGLGIYTLGDFNGDSFIDMAYIFNNAPGFTQTRIKWNDASNSFNTSSLLKDFINNSRGKTLEKFDFDNDNDLDLLVGDVRGFTLGNGTILKNEGNQNFTEHTETINNALWQGRDVEIFFSDFDGDGNVDILTNSVDDEDIMVHFQEDDSSFQNPVYLNHKFERIHNFQILDYNNDGLNDLISVDEEHNGKLEVAYGLGNNEFSSSEVIIDNATSFGAIGPQLVLWNNNSDYDLIYSSSKNLYLHLDFNTSNESLVLLYTSNPVGGAPNNGWIGYPSSSGAFSDATFFVGDIDGDGDNDLIIPQVETQTTYWLENTGGENFNLHPISTAGFDRYLLTDVDNDGDLDYIGQKRDNFETEYTFFKLEASTKQFTSYLTLSAQLSVPNSGVHHFAAGDIDDDGDEDIVIKGLEWMENDDAGNFSSPVDLVSGYDTRSNIIIDDIDNDGLLDIVTNYISANGHTLVALFNQGNNTYTTIEQGLDFNAQGSVSPITAGDFNNNGFKSLVVSDFRNSFRHTPILFNFCINTENTVDIDVCSGDSYTFADGTVQDDITQDVTFVSTLTGQAANGCDVVVTENITVITVSDMTTTTTDETITANNPNATYVWLDCNDNFAVIPGETGQSFTATANGNYAVEITENGCSEISDCVAITTLGLEDNTLSNQINMYPNPTAGDLNIQLGNTYEDVQVIVRNILGQQIMTKTYKAVQDLSLNIEAETGIYFIEITTRNQRGMSKVVKR